MSFYCVTVLVTTAQLFIKILKSEPFKSDSYIHNTAVFTSVSLEYKDNGRMLPIDTELEVQLLLSFAVISASAILKE